MQGRVAPDEVGDGGRPRHYVVEAFARHARDDALRTDLSGLLASATTMRGMLQGCTEALVRHLDIAFARIWTLRRGGRVLDLQASAGAYTRIDGAYAQVELGELKIGQIALLRRPHLTNDVLSDPRIQDKAWARAEGMVAFAGYPLVVEDRAVGVLAMFARRPLGPDTLELLESIAAAVAQGVERKRSEDDLRRSEAYLAEGQRLSHTGSWAWRIDTGERFWSREMFRVYGFELAPTPPSFAEVLGRARPEDGERLKRAFEKAFATGAEVRLVTRLSIPGQPLKWVRTYGHPVRDDEGRLVEYVGTVVDITARIRARRRLRRAILARYEAVLAERSRIAREMHDGLLQDLAGIALQLGAVLPHVRTAPDEAERELARIVAVTERSAREARQAVSGMRVPEDAVDLPSSVLEVAQRVTAASGLSFTMDVAGRPWRLPTHERDAVASIVHEAVTNVVKHAAARAVVLSIHFRPRSVQVSVRDDGRGLEAAPDALRSADHFGLLGMRERAMSAGGEFHLSSAPGLGVTVSVALPRPA